MEHCPYIEIKYHRPLPSVACTATLCALPEHGGMHVMQSGREMRKWDALLGWLESEYIEAQGEGAWVV